jgi:hypothetical protein
MPYPALWIWGKIPAGRMLTPHSLVHTMTSWNSSFARPVGRRIVTVSRLACVAMAAGVLSSCASSSAHMGSGMSGSGVAPTPDPRLSLKAGWFDAGQASWNMSLVATAKPSAAFFNPSGATAAVTNSDLAFTGGHYVVQGNYSGFQIWDVASPGAPRVVTAYVCGGVQGDVSVYKNLLFVSVESPSGRLDCGLQGVKDSVSTDRFRGVRIFDISDIAHPRKVVDVQTCRGSHTNTVVPDARDSSSVYVYVSALVTARSSTELAGCSDAAPEDVPSSERFRIDVIQVPLAHPEQSKVVNRPRILADLAPYVRHEEYAADTAAESGLMRYLKASPGGARAAQLSPLGPIATACHDITVYPAIGLAGAACIGYGLLLDIKDPANPQRITAASDTNFWGWHSVTFSNSGSEVMFTDEWGGGGAPRCRATDNPRWGGDAVYKIGGDHLTLEGYYKLPVAQPATKNCVAHNGSLIPIPGRTVMVQSWYQGGVSVFDWTDAANPKEIAYFDRGPIDSTKLEDGGTWSAYWWNGHIYSSEITRGLDVLDLRASPLITQNELDAAKTVQFDQLNVQDQQRFVWKPSFVLARAYLDQLARDDGLAATRREEAARALSAAERMDGDARHSALTTLAAGLDRDVAAAKDGAKVALLAEVVRGIGGA